MKNKFLSFLTGLTCLLGLPVMAQVAVESLYTFPSPATNGSSPAGQLVLGTDGYLYGTTKTGGAYNDINGIGCGTIFKVNPTNGAFTSLFSFNFSNGARPNGDLIFGTDGYLHGLAKAGGTGLYQNGTAFAVSTAGILESCYSFLYAPQQNLTGPGWPASGEYQGSTGYYYGVSPNGGAANAGTVFQITSSGAITVLHSFSGMGPLGTSADGSTPGNRLYQMTNGNLSGVLIGVAQTGGTNDVYYGGDGTIFTVTTNGAFTNLYNFIGTNSGSHPDGQLVQGSDGALYGVTQGGSSNNFGAVFKFNTNTYTVTVLAAFNNTNGTYPSGGLIQGPDGYLYGVSKTFDTNGSIFQASTNGAGALTNMAVFQGTNGSAPSGGVVYDANTTNYYGSAATGGNGNGVIYEMLPMPVFTNAPVSQSSTTGTKVTLTASAQGIAPLSYFWVHTNVVSTSGPGISNYSALGIGELVISNVASSNLGTYALVISNVYGVTTSAVATLQ